MTRQIQDKEQESRTLSETIRSHLREEILKGAYAPGTRVRQEDLAEQFGTSRIPVREALKDLEGEGLITLIPNSGAWIAKADPAECDEIYKIRENIEPLALYESTLKISDEVVAELTALVEQMEKSTTLEEFLLLDREFHRRSYTAASLPILHSIIERFWNTTQQYRRVYTSSVGREGQWVIHYEHRLILDAIQRRDASEAANMLRSHIRRSRLQLAKFSEQAAQTPR